MSLSKKAAETPKLPLEIIGKILLNYDDDDLLEVSKKCRLISPRFYKGVQDLFRDEFFHKYISHFDGSNQTFATSRSFGYNIFGFYRLNFATLRISNSELYLLKTFLRRLILDNLQILELKDNLLNWKEIIQVLGKFTKIVHLKFIESTSDSAKKMYKIYKADFHLMDQNIWFSSIIRQDTLRATHYNIIKREIEKKEDFLTSLKIFEVDVTHIAFINIMSLIVSSSKYCELENFSIKINIDGTKQNDFYWIHSLEYFEKFSESLRNIEICVDDSKTLKTSNDYHRYVKFLAKHHFSSKALDTLENIVNFKKISSLRINVPYASLHHLANSLSLFVKNQENLDNFSISLIEGNCTSSEDYITEFQNIMNRLMIPQNKTRFGYKYKGFSHSIYSGFSPIQNFQENLSNLIVHHTSRNSFNFSDQNCPVFLNCSELKLKFGNIFPEAMLDFQIEWIINKCPNLLKLSFVPKSRQLGQIAQITNKDLQLIIGHYENLQELHLENCIDNLTDSGLAGLTEEAIRIRSDNVDLPVKLEEISGPSISKLKKLKTLVIASHLPLQISDLSAVYGFDGMRNLKELQLTNTNITSEGFDILKEKTGSKNLHIL